jgi:hypothetical protein
MKRVAITVNRNLEKDLRIGLGKRKIRIIITENHSERIYKKYVI